MKTKILLLLLIFTTFGVAAIQAQHQINGRVTDEFDQPLHGVIVVAENHTTGTRTDHQGLFDIRIDSLTRRLIFTFPGMVSQEILLGNKNNLLVKMQAEKPDKKENSDSKNSSVSMISSPQFNFSSGRKSMHTGIIVTSDYEHNTEDYSAIHESGYRKATDEPLSTFSIDVDKASYSNIRRFINGGQLPPKDAVRIEEMINYFHYNYPEPENDEPFRIVSEFTTCPWNDDHQLVLIAIQGKEVSSVDLPTSNLVFLIDVSGSMQAANKLQLVKSSLKMLVNEIRPQDKVAIVTYAGSASIALESTSGTNKRKINEAIDQLKAGGSTAGADGIKMAYKVASENFMKEGNNRIVMATDGDFNVGQSSDAEMERLVTLQSNHNIFLTVLGFGMGNLKDNKLETMADKGNGNYAYIDNSQEAYKVFIKEFGGTLFTIAKDVKIQVEFNPQQVKAYRLIGYENRALANNDFNNDKKDAGELGSGQQVTAIYEIIPAASTEEVSGTNELKYQTKTTVIQNKNKDELLTVKMRFKKPDGENSQLIEQVLNNECTNFKKASNNIKFAAAISQFGMLLRDSEFKGNSTYKNTIAIAKDAISINDDGDKGEFIRLVNTAESLGLTDLLSK